MSFQKYIQHLQCPKDSSLQLTWILHKNSLSKKVDYCPQFKPATTQAKIWRYPWLSQRVFLTVLNQDFAYTIQTQEMVCYILLEVPYALQFTRTMHKVELSQFCVQGEWLPLLYLVKLGRHTSTTPKRHIPIPTIGVLYLCVHAFQVLSLDEDGRLKVLPKSPFL